MTWKLQYNVSLCRNWHLTVTTTELGSFFTYSCTLRYSKAWTKEGREETELNCNCPTWGRVSTTFMQYHQLTLQTILDHHAVVLRINWKMGKEFSAPKTSSNCTEHHPVPARSWSHQQLIWSNRYGSFDGLSQVGVSVSVQYYKVTMSKDEYITTSLSPFASL